MEIFYFIIETGIETEETLVMSPLGNPRSVKSDILTLKAISLMCESGLRLSQTLYGTHENVINSECFIDFPDELKLLIGKFKDIGPEIKRGSTLKYGKIVKIEYIKQKMDYSQ